MKARIQKNSCSESFHYLTDYLDAYIPNPFALALALASGENLEDPPYDRAVIMWSGWWAAKLKETAPNIRTAPSASARSILFNIASTSESNVLATSSSSTARFWSFQPEINMNFSMYFKEYQKRYQILEEHSPITATVQHHIKNLLLFHVRNMQPVLANRCRDYSYADMITEFRK
ncbi:hypothetical protein K3495_g1788 [Podosphaera aphanis]|nr:hypothetical protein K3495_g1788 [Podosphaera aphanis]